MAEDKNVVYNNNVKAVCDAHNENIVSNLIKHLGIALRSSKDAAIVACSDKSELDRIKNGFMKKKLGLTADDAELNKALKEVCEKMGSSNKSKCRVAFYYLLVEKFGKQADFA